MDGRAMWLPGVPFEMSIPLAKRWCNGEAFLSSASRFAWCLRCLRCLVIACRLPSKKPHPGDFLQRATKFTRTSEWG